MNKVLKHTVCTTTFGSIICFPRVGIISDVLTLIKQKSNKDKNL